MPGQPTELYAVKHTGFIQFRSVQDDPTLATKIVGFEQLDRDLATGQVPNYAHIVPNQCNEMHGRDGRNVPPDCRFDNDQGRISPRRQGDRRVGQQDPGLADLVGAGQHGDRHHLGRGRRSARKRPSRQGCCGYDPDSPANFGGGHIPTIVITNHGPRGVTDDTPYNHYSLLRTTEDAFCIGEYLGPCR